MIHAVLVPFILLGAAPPPEPAPSPAPPVFASDVDVVAVDVNVVDREGRPVRTLTPEDFALTVDGRPRRVVSAQFIALGEGALAPSPPAAAGASPPAYSTNEGAPTGRLVVLVVDAGNIRMGGGRSAVQAADRLLDQLTPEDRAALVTLPARGGPQVDLTGEHALIRKAITKVVGRSRAAGRRLTVTESMAYEDGDEEWSEALERECPTTVLSGDALIICQQDLMAEATTVAQGARQAARDSRNGMLSLFESLRRIDGPKSVVLVTEGLLFESWGEVRDLATAASAARVTLYVLRLDTGLPDAEVATLHHASTSDARIKAEGLDRLTGLTRGATFPVTGSGARVFERIGRELSGYYLLGFEPETGDRDGAAHEIEVRVLRPGLTVRARRAMSIPTSAPSAEAARDIVASALQSPFLATELPVRATTFTLADAGDKVRLVVAADIGAPGTVPAGLSIGWALLTPGGRVVTSAIQRAGEEQGAAGHARGVPYLGSAAVPPGRYTLRLAAVDARGRRGSVEHPVAALLTAAGGIEATDLLLGPPARQTGESLKPGVEVDASRGLVAYAELLEREPGALTAATAVVEAATSEDGPALVSSPAALGPVSEGRRPAQGTLATPVLPAGDYVARLVVSVSGRPALRVVRPFSVGAREAGGAGVLSAAEVAAALPPFQLADVLAEDVTSVVLSAAPPAAQPDLRRGLDLLTRGELPAAGQAFRAATRAAPASLGAAFYLGAAFAAAGNDREAVGGWQTARIAGLPGPAAYAVLSDALVRLGDVEAAMDAVREGLERWPNHPRLLRGLAIAHALRGERADARGILAAHVAAQPDDAPAQFLLVRLLLEDLRAAPADPLAREALERHARAYVAAGGQHAALVSAWIESARQGAP